MSLKRGSNRDLHGNAPDQCDIALLLIDVINDLAFEGSERLFKHALPMAERIADLCNKASAGRIPIIYVNDNFGRWRSDFQTQVAHCLNDGVPGREIVELLLPHREDYFVLKPKHSGFFSTTLDLLLDYLGAETLILTGIAANNCVLVTANDAYMRDYKLIVPADCVASNTLDQTNQALEQMKSVLKADICNSKELKLPK